MPAPTSVPCKEKDCDRLVPYQRTVVRGYQPLPIARQTVAVYLTCANGHTHKYEFPVPP
jgi:hypothetical protein